MKQTGAQIIVQKLINQGVDVVFGYPGAAVVRLFDELDKCGKIKTVLVRHEQAAIHAAEGYARATGKTGVALVTSGPGATNTITGIADAFLDSTPIVCLTGQVDRCLIGQSAFQEADITGITRTISKYNMMIADIEQLPHQIDEAFHIASTGRPGPVVVDIPADVQGQTLDWVDSPYHGRKSYHVDNQYSAMEIAHAVALIQAAKKGIIYAGGGVIHSGIGASEALRQLAEKTNFPVTVTLMGLGAFPGKHPQFLGMLGLHGSYEANMAMHEADLIIAVGARFDNRVTGALSEFAPQAKIIHIDIDNTSIDKVVQADIGLVGDAKSVLTDLIVGISPIEKQADWWQQIQDWRAINCFDFMQDEAGTIKPQYVMQQLAQMCPDMRLTTDVGQHQMFVANYFKFNYPRQMITSGGMGTMGYGMPAAIGALLADKSRPVVCISGDGSFLMNIQELATVAMYNVPLKVIIFNNGYLGMVKQLQDLAFNSRYVVTDLGQGPDFIGIACAFGVQGRTISKTSELQEGLDELLHSPTAFVLNIATDSNEGCFPMIRPGKGHHEMILRR